MTEQIVMVDMTDELKDHDPSVSVHTNLKADQCCRQSRPKVIGSMTGEVCMDCGGMTIRTGTCTTCTNCGTSGGCG